MQKITPFLWYNNQAEEAAQLYTSLIADSAILNVSRYSKKGSEVSGLPAGTVMLVTFKLAGQEFMALNGGPMLQFSQATSFMIHCETQAEIDRLWEKLGEGGQTQACGWLIDRFGVSWQIVPAILSKLLQSEDASISARVMEALLQMTKLDIAVLQKAYEGGEPKTDRGESR